jgi:dTDP-4-dehydrorhamnose reductase
MKILVAGANGFLGRSLLSLDKGIEWIGCGRGAVSVGEDAYYQVDLVNHQAVAKLLVEVRPDWVVNAAALTNVDQCETNRDLARRANLELIDHLSTACQQVDAGLVQLSTDYVFDGNNGPYAEQDEPNPLSYYGRLKLESERLVMEMPGRFLVIRTLWLYGYVPHVRPNFVTWALEGLHRGDSLKVFDDQWGNPTYVNDLAQALVELCNHDAQGLFHMGGATFLTRYELALELVRFFGLDAGLVEPISTQTGNLKAVRPLRSGLQTGALEAKLKRKPLSFVEGLEQMLRQENFLRDYAHLL